GVGDKPLIILSTIFVLSISFIIALMLFSFIIGVYIIFFTKEGILMSKNLINTPYILIAGLPIPIPISITIGTLFTFSWIIYLIFFIIALKEPRNFIEVLKVIRKEGPKAILDNTIFTVTSIFTILVITTLIIQYLQESSGIPTGSMPETEPILMFVSISIAPLIEEIGFRLSLIGLLAAYLAFMAHKSTYSFYALWHPKNCLKKVIGNNLSKEMGILNIMIILSSVFFGMAHITYGAGWGIGKVTQAALAGIALGWLYLHYGFPATVLLHWAFNYFTSAYHYFNKIVHIIYLTDLTSISIIFTGMLGYLVIIILIIEKRLRLSTNQIS
ncbi:MAG: CPBP family intramembrane glutamic endopeptidase, partial [Nitrososphaerales archaeon]